MRGFRRIAVVAAAALVAGMLVTSPAVADDPTPITLAAFEGGEPFAYPPNAGIFTWAVPPSLTG
jgi:beta-glucosidase